MFPNWTWQPSAHMKIPDPSPPPDFEALFEAAPGLLLAMLPDDAFHIAAASDTYLRATMTRREEIVGRSVFDAFPDNPDDPAARSTQGLRATLERARRERTLATMPVYQHDLRRPEAEGGGFEKRFWQTSVWPVPAGPTAGPLRYLLCRTEDVTARLRSERERDDAHIRLEATLGAAEMGTWIWEVDTNRIFADRHLARLFNVSAADADGGPLEHYLSAVHPDDIPATREAIGRAVREGTNYAVEYRLARPEGGYRWVVARGWAERDATGYVRRFPGVVLDVTERKQAEETLRENEERLRMAIESAWLGTFDYDPQTDMLLWSDTCRALFGVPPGVPVSYKTTFSEILHPDDRERVLAAVAEALRPGSDGVYDTEYRVVLPDGTERWIAAAGRGFFDTENHPRRFIGTVLDITERKRAQQAAEHRSSQLQQLAVIAARLNAAHDVRSVLGILTEEARQLIGARQSVTQAEAAGRSSDGEPLTVVSRPGGSPFVNAAPPAIPPAARGEALSVPLIGRNGQRLGVIHLTNKEESTFDTDDAALLAQLSQIAAGAIENARLYEELRGNDRRKDEFLAMLAHELRNPLSAILNAVALGGEGAPAEDLAWSMEVIQRQLRQLTRLIDDLLDVSRITRGKVQLRKELLDASHVLQRAVDTVRGLMAERRHALDVSLRDETLPLEADPTRLEQIFVNLLTNAAHYTEKGGEISLRATRENGHVVIRVRDNGMGIAPEKLPQMFELFAQGDRSLARSEGGLGVGLTIVRSLTEMHGGTVHAHSEGEGKGSEFVVRLPVAVERETAAAAAAGGGPGKAVLPVKKEPTRVLVVDDNEDSANATAKILSRHAYGVRVAYNGPDAVEAAHEFRPEFVLLDIGLPGMDGYEVARCLRGDAELCGVKLVAVSGYGQESDRRRSREAGFDQHLVKPVDPDKLLTLLRETARG